jgi:hypothetical protein
MPTFDRIKLRHAVREDLDAAIKENNYTDLLDLSVDDLIGDMLSFSSGYDEWIDLHEDPEFLREMAGSIEEWMEEHRKA